MVETEWQSVIQKDTMVTKLAQRLKKKYKIRLRLIRKTFSFMMLDGTTVLIYQIAYKI